MNKKEELLLKKNDKLFQTMCHDKMCLYCGKPAQCVHHVVKRANLLTRWIPANGQNVCVKCHNKIHDGNLTEYAIPQDIRQLGRVNFKDFLLLNAKTKFEFFELVNIRLKEYLE